MSKCLPGIDGKGCEGELKQREQPTRRHRSLEKGKRSVPAGAQCMVRGATGPLGQRLGCGGIYRPLEQSAFILESTQGAPHGLKGSDMVGWLREEEDSGSTAHFSC